MDARTNFIEDAAATAVRYKELGERAMAQLSDDQLHWRSDPRSNSVAILVQHVGGNLRSRWSDYLMSDGEKSDRHRDEEFVGQALDREELMARWNEGWSEMLGALRALKAEDLVRTAPIRGQEHTVVEATLRSLGHCAYHVGQIVQLARQLVGDEEWRTLSIARGESSSYEPKGRI